MNNPITRPTLLMRLRDKQNEGAWAEFVGLYTPIVFGFCTQRGLSEADAADVAQEVMCAVAGSMDGFAYDPARGKFRNWLLTVTRNKFNNLLGRQYRQPVANGSTTVIELLSEQPAHDEAQRWDEEYQRNLFRWAAAKVQGEFEPKTWEAFWQTAMLDRPGQEVADALGISAGAVYIARSRVLARLKERIAEGLKGFGLEPEF
jgi:RNA polymerase sigma factor (sigma-70 family)